MVPTASVRKSERGVQPAWRGIGMALVRVLACAVALSLAACSRDEPTDEAMDQAYENADEQLSDANYEDVAGTSQCTEDCSGHDAGFEWARDHEVTDSSECGGDSQSFVDGCEEFANARDEAAQEDLDDSGQGEDE
jgi:hypothetical protein